RLVTSNEGSSEQVLALSSDSIPYQVGFCSRWLLDQILLLPKSFIPCVKLSTDRLSARSDEWTNRTTIRSKFEVNSGVYFYEVLLLTGGPVRVGWTSGKADLAAELLDKQSICFDGYLQRIWHDGASIVLNEKRWKAGDIVGALLDLTNHQVTFYLNGHP